MAQKLLKRKPHKVAPKKAQVDETGRAGTHPALSPLRGSLRSEDMRTPSAVLVGTYKEGQLSWIKRHGIYNYLVKDGDEFDEKSFASIKELWLYADVKGTRHVFEAEFIGIKTREELVDEYGYPANGVFNAETQRRRGGRARTLAAPHGSRYYVFKTKYLDYGPRLDDPSVIVRTADFGGRSAKVKKAIEQFKADGEFAPLEHYLPSDLAKVPRNRLRVCEAAVQLCFWNMPELKNLMPAVPFPPPAHPKFTFIDLFAGIGGFRLAMQAHGGECVFSSEWDAKAQETYSANFGDVPYGDITKMETRNAIPDDFDILCGGFPCQPFSSIGKREGFAHPTQGTLFFHIQQILNEKRPKAFILENVPGLITHQGGQTLQTIKDVLRDELNYTMDYMVLNSADFGVPQYRKRLYLIGFRQDIPIYVKGTDSLNGNVVSSDGRTPKGNVVFNFPEGRFTNDHVGFGKFVEREAKGPSISKYLQKTYIFKADDGHPEVVDENFDHPVKTLCASYHKIQRLTGTFVRGGETGLRLLTESECKYIMGFPQHYIVPVSRTSMYHQFGNSVAVPVIDELADTMIKTMRKAEANR